MPDVYEVQGPDGQVYEMMADHPPTREEAHAAIGRAGRASVQPPSAPDWWPRDRFGNPISTTDHPLDESGQPANWADRTFTPDNLATAQLAADALTMAPAVGAATMSGLRMIPQGVRGVPGKALTFAGENARKFDLTHPTGLIGDLMQWAGKKLTPTPEMPPTPRPIAQVPPADRSNVSAALRQREMRDAAQLPRAVQQPSTTTAPVVPPPVAPTQPVDRVDVLAALRQREIREAAQSPRAVQQPATTTPTPPVAPTQPVDRVDVLAALRQRQMREAAQQPRAVQQPATTTPTPVVPKPPTGPQPRHVGRAPTMNEAVMEALLEQTGATPTPSQVTLPRAPGMDITPGGNPSKASIPITEPVVSPAKPAASPVTQTAPVKPTPAPETAAPVTQSPAAKTPKQLNEEAILRERAKRAAARAQAEGAATDPVASADPAAPPADTPPSSPIEQLAASGSFAGLPSTEDVVANVVRRNDTGNWDIPQADMLAKLMEMMRK